MRLTAALCALLPIPVLAQVLLARPDPGDPIPDPPEPATWAAIDLGDSSSADVTETSPSEIDVTGDGTDDELNGGFAYITSSSPELQVIGRFVEFDDMAELNQWTFSGLLLIDDYEDSTSAYGAVQRVHQGFGGSEGDGEPSFKYRSQSGVGIGKHRGDESSLPQCFAFTWKQSTQTFRGFISADMTCDANATFVEMTGSPVQLAISVPYAYGVFVASHELGQASVASWDSIAVSTTITIGTEEDPVDPPDPPADLAYPLTAYNAWGGNVTMTGSEGEQIRANLGRYKQIMLGADTETYFSAGWTREQLVQDLKSRQASNHGYPYVANYFVVNASYPPLSGSGVPPPRWTAWVNATESAKCWAYLNGSGTPSHQNGNNVARSVFDNRVWNTNIVYGPCNDWIEDTAEFICGALLKTGDGIQQDYSAAPSLDGLLYDNHFRVPRVDWDYDMDGDTDSRTDPAFGFALRQGWQLFEETFDTLCPGYHLGGNWDGYDDAGGSIAPLENVGDITLVEGFYGTSWSHHHFWAAHKMLAMLRNAALQTAEGGRAYAMIGTYGVNPLTDAQELRERVYHVGLAQAAGVYASLFGTSLNLNLAQTQQAWLDEWDFGGDDDYNWMGERVSPHLNCNISNLTCTSALDGEILKVEFENAWIVCNVHTSGYADRNATLGATLTTTLPDTVERINGGQTANTGATHTAGQNISVPDRTCLFMRKVS